MTIQGHPRSLILAPIESACGTGFLLLLNSNLESKSTILPRFRDIRAFVHRKQLFAFTPPLFRPKFQGVPFGVDP